MLKRLLSVTLLMCAFMVPSLSAYGYSNKIDEEMAIAYADKPAANLEVEDTTDESATTEASDGKFIDFLKKKFADLMDEYHRLMEEEKVEQVGTEASPGTPENTETQEKPTSS